MFSLGAKKSTVRSSVGPECRRHTGAPLAKPQKGWEIVKIVERPSERAWELGSIRETRRMENAQSEITEFIRKIPDDAKRLAISFNTDPFGMNSLGNPEMSSKGLGF